MTADRRAVPDVSLLADVLPGYAIYCTAGATASDQNRAPVDRGRRHQRGDAAAGRRASRWSTRSCAAPPPGRSGWPTRCSTRSPRSPTAGDVFSDVVANDNDLGRLSHGGKPLGCCTAARLRRRLRPGQRQPAGSPSSPARRRRTIADVGLSLPAPAAAPALRDGLAWLLGAACSGAARSVRLRAHPVGVRRREHLLLTQGARTVVRLHQRGAHKTVRTGARRTRRADARLRTALDSGGNVERVTATAYGAITRPDAAERLWHARRGPGSGCALPDACRRRRPDGRNARSRPRR